MSLELIVFARRFVEGSLSAEAFSDPYMAQWKEERDLNKLKDDSASVSECASSIFVLADCFNPESDRDADELDEVGLKQEVEATLRKFGFL
ncbi:colicin immunity domain-containing protein [Pseudomonas sp. Q11]|uniref:colicin immunity domain-containing protein n=1 Tax=Pseudomonas sp. Q11 TaxID=2968470 RepID=UPI00210EAE7D|nr:colicin immunity domain-containing protein [Pseudomonas sp. Q11]MCQ6256857.1 colicin immunity domain-containing protein [Pseudomonas sp. Q11]